MALLTEWRTMTPKQIATIIRREQANLESKRPTGKRTAKYWRIVNQLWADYRETVFGNQERFVQQIAAKASFGR